MRRSIRAFKLGAAGRRSGIPPWRGSPARCTARTVPRRSVAPSTCPAPSFAAIPAALALAAVALCAFSLALLNDGDTWSHVGTGEWILDHRAVPHVDPFSFTRTGEPWVAHEWLAEVAFALVYRAAGWAGTGPPLLPVEAPGIGSGP